MNLPETTEMNDLLARIKTRFEMRNRSGLVCKQGYYRDCWVLKLQRPSWTNDPIDQIWNQSGIFFSVWGDERSLKRNRLHYNIHALKLRELQGHAITSRDFAREFRERFEAVRSTWPNVRVDFGPATLMQGWIENEMDLLGNDILHLLKGFVRLGPVIDGLLASRRR